MVLFNKRELGLKFLKLIKVDDLKYSRLTYGDRGAFSINNLGYKFLKTSLKT